jgi:hypothetical protein
MGLPEVGFFPVGLPEVDYFLGNLLVNLNSHIHYPFSFHNHVFVVGILSFPAQEFEVWIS